MVVTAAVSLLGVILGGAILVATLSKQPTAAQQRRAHADAVSSTPRSIDQPNSGTAPKHPGDRGGWEQLTLLGLIVGAVAIGGFALWRGGGKAKAGREAWRAAAATGRDGAASEPVHTT